MVVVFIVFEEFFKLNFTACNFWFIIVVSKSKRSSGMGMAGNVIYFEFMVSFNPNSALTFRLGKWSVSRMTFASLVGDRFVCTASAFLLFRDYSNKLEFHRRKKLILYFWKWKRSRNIVTGTNFWSIVSNRETLAIVFSWPTQW